MKYLSLVFCALLFVSGNAFAGDWFDLAPATNDTILLNSNGKDTTVSINFIRRDQTFSESLYMTYLFEYYTAGKGWVPCNDTYGQNSCYKLKTPSLAVNQPYKSVGITFTPKSEVDTMGLYRVRITAANGPKSSGCVVYLRVTPYSNTSQFYVLKDLGLVDRIVISYDTSINSPIKQQIGVTNTFKRWEYLIGKGPTLRKIFYQVEGVSQYCFSVDKQSNFWLASFKNLTKYGKVYATTYTAENSDYRTGGTTLYMTHKFIHLQDGTTFVSDDVGTFKIKDGIVSRFPSDDVLLANTRTYSLCEYNDTVWVVYQPPMRNPNSFTRIEPVYKYYGNTIEKLPTRLADTNELVSAGGMTLDRKGVLWGDVLIYNKWGELKRREFVKFDGTNWVPVRGLDSTNSDYNGSPKSIVFDNHDKMWILTNKKNLIEFDGEKIGRVIEGKDTPLENTNFKFMIIDSSNTIYFDNRSGVILFNPDGIALPSIAVTAVEEPETTPNNSGVFPLPAKDYVTFDLPADAVENTTTIEILSSQGMVVMPSVSLTQQLETRYTLATNELASGLYFAVIHSGKTIIKKPFMVVR